MLVQFSIQPSEKECNVVLRLARPTCVCNKVPPIYACSRHPPTVRMSVHRDAKRTSSLLRSPPSVCPPSLGGRAHKWERAAKCCPSGLAPPFGTAPSRTTVTNAPPRRQALLVVTILQVRRDNIASHTGAHVPTFKPSARVQTHVIRGVAPHDTSARLNPRTRQHPRSTFLLPAIIIKLVHTIYGTNPKT